VTELWRCGSTLLATTIASLNKWRAWDDHSKRRDVLALVIIIQ
jgi:hypothetical protein